MPSNYRIERRVSDKLPRLSIGARGAQLRYLEPPSVGTVLQKLAEYAVELGVKLGADD